MGLALCAALPAQAVDADAAQALAKKDGCTKCHSVSAKKDGPSFKETAAKYKGQADAEQKLITHVTTGPKIMVEGKEEVHPKHQGRASNDQVKNLVQWILAQPVGEPLFAGDAMGRRLENLRARLARHSAIEARDRGGGDRPARGRLRLARRHGGGPRRDATRRTFCIGCHEMRDNVYVEYKGTIHDSNRTGVRASCPDCHVPHELGPKLVRKVEASAELWGSITGKIDTKEKFEKHRYELASNEWRKMKATDSRECRNRATSREGMSKERQSGESNT